MQKFNKTATEQIIMSLLHLGIFNAIFVFIYIKNFILENFAEFGVSILTFYFFFFVFAILVYLERGDVQDALRQSIQMNWL